MPECKACTMEVLKVHLSGNCNDCEAFMTPDPAKSMPNDVFEYDRWITTTYQCVRCGGTQFNVGRGAYRTVIRCPACKWERLVHEG